LSLFHIDAGREWRGGQRQAFILARELKRKGYPFFFVVQPKTPLYFKAKEADLPIFSLRMRNEFDLMAILRLAIKMRRNRCLLAHFHDAHSVAVGSIAASLAKVPIRIISRRVDFPLRRNFFTKRKYTKNVDAIIAISEGVKEVLIKGGIRADSIEIVPSGIDFSIYEKASSSDYLRREFSFAPDDYLVGIVAHLADHKGHKYLIQATKILKEYTDKIKVIIVGEGPLRWKLSKQAQDLKIKDIVFFLGFREDIPQILSSLDLFVLSSYLEGLGSSLLDAMACRLPVVATRIGGIPEVVLHRETGLLVPPRNSFSLAKAILKLYKDRALASRLGNRGYEVVRQKFSVETMAEKIIDVYEKIATRKALNLLGQGR
jgi:glycosyltransferase involved in cell wall biosynthesis